MELRAKGVMLLEERRRASHVVTMGDAMAEGMGTREVSCAKTGVKGGFGNNDGFLGVVVDLKRVDSLLSSLSRRSDQSLTIDDGASAVGSFLAAGVLGSVATFSAEVASTTSGGTGLDGVFFFKGNNLNGDMAERRRWNGVLVLAVLERGMTASLSSSFVGVANDNVFLAAGEYK